MGLIPAGAYRNQAFRSAMVEVAEGVADDLAMVLHDPQTSGGLLICLAADQADELVRELHEGGIGDAAVIGGITADHPGRILVTG
jgi:selenide,water dikinase